LPPEGTSVGLCYSKVDKSAVKAVGLSCFLPTFENETPKKTTGHKKKWQRKVSDLSGGYRVASRETCAKQWFGPRSPAEMIPSNSLGPVSNPLPENVE